MPSDYDRGYADGHADGFTKGSLAARGGLPETSPADKRELIFWVLHGALRDLEDENARLIAKLRGYVLAGSAKGPGVLVRHGTATARGVNREAYKPRHRHPFVLASDGTWKRAKGRLRLEDWAMRLPPKVCEMCGHLFVAGRRDAKTCSPACRVNLHRKHKHR
jgi:hypothetical protein